MGIFLCLVYDRVPATEGRGSSVGRKSDLSSKTVHILKKLLFVSTEYNTLQSTSKATLGSRHGIR